MNYIICKCHFHSFHTSGALGPEAMSRPNMMSLSTEVPLSMAMLAAITLATCTLITSIEGEIYVFLIVVFFILY